MLDYKLVHFYICIAITTLLQPSIASLFACFTILYNSDVPYQFSIAVIFIIIMIILITLCLIIIYIYIGCYPVV